MGPVSKRIIYSPTRLPRRRYAAYTLLEMIVATALCSILLVGLWTLYSTYAHLFDQGQARVERSQLSRALMQQIADDLQSAIQDPIPGLPDRRGGDAQRRRFGFSGTSNDLRVDVLQITPRQGSRLPVGAAGQPTDAPAARVPELRTIFYSFTSPSSAIDDPESQTAAMPRGLIRRELDFETPIDDQDELETGPATAASLVGETPFEDTDQPSPRDETGSSSSTAVDDRWTWVPEVVSLQFRYFDGVGWTSSWNSLQRNSLPVAVEVRIGLADPRAPEQPVAEPIEDQADESVAPVTSPATQLQMVVDLPGSAEYRRPRVVKTPTTQPVPRLTAPRIAPPRWTSPASPKPAAQRSEDWLRTSRP
jgi:type II secretory pathway pseudopilin PulG